MSDSTENQKWHVGREVPIVLLATLLSYLGGFVWVAAKFDSHLTEHDARITHLEQQEQEGRTPLQTIAERLARIEGQLQYITGRKDDSNGLRPEFQQGSPIHAQTGRADVK